MVRSLYFARPENVKLLACWTENAHPSINELARRANITLVHSCPSFIGAKMIVAVCTYEQVEEVRALVHQLAVVLFDIAKATTREPEPIVRIQPALVAI